MKKGKIIGISKAEHTILFKIKPSKLTMDILDKIFNIYHDYDVTDDISGFKGESYRVYEEWSKWFDNLHLGFMGTTVHLVFTEKILYLLFAKKGHYKKLEKEILEYFEFKPKKPRTKRRKK